MINWIFIDKFSSVMPEAIAADISLSHLSGICVLHLETLFIIFTFHFQIKISKRPFPKIVPLEPRSAIQRIGNNKKNFLDKLKTNVA